MLVPASIRSLCESVTVWHLTWSVLGIAYVSWWLRQRWPSLRSSLSSSSWLNDDESAAPAPLVPSSLPFFGHLWSLIWSRDSFLRHCHSCYGDVFTLMVAGQSLTFVTHNANFQLVAKLPANVVSFNSIAERVLTRSLGFSGDAAHAVYTKQSLRDFNTYLQGASLEPLLTAFQRQLAPQLHSFIRQSPNPEDHSQHVPSSRSTREASFHEGEWCLQPINLYEWVWPVLFSSTCQSLQGSSFRSESAMEPFRRFDDVARLLLMGIPLDRWAEPDRQKLLTILQHTALDDTSSEIVHVRHRYCESLQLSEEDQARFDLSLLWGAIINSGPTLFWTLYNLGKCPQAVRDTLRQELQVAVNTYESAHSGTVTVDEHGFPWLSRDVLNGSTLPLLQSAVYEAMRLANDEFVVREIVHDHVLQLHNGRKIQLAGGGLLLMLPKVVHMDPQIYPAPDRFQYDRFVGENAPPLPVSFGIGAHMCPGRYLALNQVMQFTAAMLFMCDWEVLNVSTPMQRGVPTSPVRWRLRRRSLPTAPLSAST